MSQAKYPTISEVTIEFGRFAQMRKDRGLENEEQDRLYDVFHNMMELYTATGQPVPNDSALPGVISEYMKAIPEGERTNTMYKTIYFILGRYNEGIKAAGGK